MGTSTRMEESPVEEIFRCVAVCRETLEGYGSDDPPAERVRSDLLLVIAALETAAALDDDGSRREAALLIAATLARNTAGVLRGRADDDLLVRCAGACEQVAAACERALGDPGRRD